MSMACIVSLSIVMGSLFSVSWLRKRLSSVSGIRAFCGMVFICVFSPAVRGVCAFLFAIR